MIREALSALAEAALMVAALTGISLLIIAPFVLTYRGGAWIFLGLITWPAAAWGVLRLDTREGR